MTELPKGIATEQPRARGEVRARFDRRGVATRLADLRQAGSSRALFPRPHGKSIQMVLTNTSGGVTGGDRFRTDIVVEGGATVTITSQAAERAYRAQPGQTGRIDTTLRVGTGSRINWVPQETILFNGCAFARRLTLDIGAGGCALLVEPVVFGRSAMGECLNAGHFDDQVEIRTRDGIQFLDRTRLVEDIAATLRGPAVANGMTAVALVVFAHPAAEAKLGKVRAQLAKIGGASLVRPDLLVARLVAKDGFELRQALVPVIELLMDDVIPRPWMI